MGHDEDRRLEGWLVSPPSLPPVVWPFTALRSEFSSPHYLGAASLTPHTGQRAIDCNPVAHLADSVYEATVELIEELLSATDRMIEGHMIASGETVQGDIQIMDPNAGHCRSSNE
jgi:hypothetical protein